MYKIVNRQELNNDNVKLEFYAKDIVKSWKMGQFVILKVDDSGERFPLTIHNGDLSRGTVTVVFQKVGVSTNKLSSLKVGDSILDVLGPLGHGVDIKNIDNAVLVGGGVGIAEIYPVAKYLKGISKKLYAILGARTKELVICEDELRDICEDVFVTTDDGSYGRAGFVSDELKELLEREKIDFVFTVGPVIMMKVIADITKILNVKTVASLNSIMVDGTGMCGSCRVTYNNKTKFVCVDGPHFDAHLVDFEELAKRQTRYTDKEKQALEIYKHKCKIS